MWERLKVILWSIDFLSEFNYFRNELSKHFYNGFYLYLFTFLIYHLFQKRKSLKIIVSSATVDAEQLRDFLNLNTSNESGKDTASILSVEGRLYPVSMFYAKGKSSNYSLINLFVWIITRRKERIADACTGHDSAVSLIKYGVGPAVSMGWHGSCISAHGNFHARPHSHM